MPDNGRTGRGSLRLRLTLLSAGLIALIGLVLLFLAYLLVGQVGSLVPYPSLVDQGRRGVLVFGAIALPVQIIVGSATAWVLVGRTLRPLSILTTAARAMSESSLDQRIDLVGPADEIAELADTFDEMTARLKAAFDAERRFVANASHELRTPLAVIRTEIDVTLADPVAGEAELRAMAEVIREATARADRLLGSLLVLARTQARGVAAAGQVELAALVGPVIASVEVAAAAKQLRIGTNLTAVTVTGDPLLLERLIGNLVENAVRHNVCGGWLTVVVRRRGNRAELDVESSGPIIDQVRVGELFEPFRQGLSARTSHTGSGLGLSIVREVVAAHDGSIEAKPVAGGGLSVVVTLPFATPPFEA